MVIVLFSLIFVVKQRALWGRAVPTPVLISLIFVVKQTVRTQPCLKPRQRLTECHSYCQSDASAFKGLSRRHLASTADAKRRLTRELWDQFGKPPTKRSFLGKSRIYPDNQWVGNKKTRGVKFRGTRVCK
jgi:hypothetical protein